MAPDGTIVLFDVKDFKKEVIGMNLKNSWLEKLPITHRVLHNKENPENSMGAFQNSINLGLPIELDVHITEDGKVVVIYDYNTKKMTSVDKLN
ncbi:MAG: glycerophosphodiester phosphodiesterase family protein [Clostridia bacterium]|nr:glycerophosphodiester phosphodiesterase family protein [Clostridia bacterium]